MFDISGKVALITGGASGIGRAIAQRFVRAGARVAIVDRVDASTMASDLGTSSYKADISRESELVAAFEAARRDFSRLDIVINNAGIQPLGVGFADLSTQLLDRTFAVNVNGVAFGIKHAARLVEPGGRVINTGSFVGQLATPGAAAYAASKAAVIHLTKLGAIELGKRRITVNCVCPGAVSTPAITDIPDNPAIPFIERTALLERLATTEEVAAAYHYLASPEAAYLTGQVLTVDGGLTAGWSRYDLVKPANVVDDEWVDDSPDSK